MALGNGGNNMNKPFSMIVIEKLKKNETVICPKCHKGNIEAKGNIENSKYFYCSNPECNGKIILN